MKRANNNKGKQPARQPAPRRPQPRAAPTRSAPLAKARQFAWNAAKTLGSMVLRNKELIGTIAGSDSFAASGCYRVNPGIATTFPYLSGIACNFEQYRFRKLILRYLTRVGADTKGSVIINPDYNSSIEPPSSEAEAANNADAVEGPAWQDISVALDPRAMHPSGPRYVQERLGSLSKALTDAAAFNVSTVGMTDSSDVGKLWAEYEVELIKPQTRTPTGEGGPTAPVATVHDDTSQELTNGIGAFLLLGIEYSTIGVTQESTTTLDLPGGVFLVQGYAEFATDTSEDFTARLDVTIGGGIVSTSYLGLTAIAGVRNCVPFQTVVCVGAGSNLNLKATLSGGSGTLTCESRRMVITPLSAT
jgi:hypothetical protein